jgi:hypothetical protein
MKFGNIKDHMIDLNYSFIVFLFHLYNFFNVIFSRLKFGTNVYHRPMSHIEQKRVEVSQALLNIWSSDEQTLFHRIITGDESWFYLDYSSDHIWSCAGDDIPERINHTIQSEKFMLTVLWSTRGPPVVEWMERGQHFNSTYFCAVIINELVHKLKTMGPFPRKNWDHLHLDNARPHV